ncbi:putative phosphinothricin N-acetyltransferase [Klebsiella aerogenes]|nr:putative phosphinothricin N-acetyltransferase [Klebsiella aerogenes]
MHIINAEEQHITAIRNIYAHHVLHGTGSFETEPPDTQEMLNRLRSIQSRDSLGMSLCMAIRSSATVIFPVTANAMPIGIRSKIRYILIRLISDRASEKHCSIMH